MQFRLKYMLMVTSGITERIICLHGTIFVEGITLENLFNINFRIRIIFHNSVTSNRPLFASIPV